MKPGVFQHRNEDVCVTADAEALVTSQLLLAATAARAGMGERGIPSDATLDLLRECVRLERRADYGILALLTYNRFSTRMTSTSSFEVMVRRWRFLCGSDVMEASQIKFVPLDEITIKLEVKGP